MPVFGHVPDASRTRFLNPSGIKAKMATPLNMDLLEMEIYEPPDAPLASDAHLLAAGALLVGYAAHASSLPTPDPSLALRHPGHSSTLRHNVWSVGGTKKK